MAAIGDLETCTWLKLAGIGEIYPVDENQDSFEILTSLWSRDDISIILITPEITNMYHQEISKFMEKNLFPIIMELPLKGKETKDPLIDLLRRAVGIKMDL